MNQPSNQLVEEELRRRRARAEAATLDTAGAVRKISIARMVFWGLSLVPFAGFAAAGIALCIGLFGTMYVGFKGNLPGAGKQYLITALGSICALIACAISSFMFVGVIGRL
jgi:hypothetical protein